MKTAFHMSLGAAALAFTTASSAAIVYRETPPIVYELQSYQQQGASQAAAAEPVQMPSYAADSSMSSFHFGGETVNDTLLAEDIARALADDRRLEGAVVTVSARNGEVSLSGSASSSEQGSYAQEIARGISGVRSVTGTLSAVGG